jgi:hypothetical protein
VRRLLKWIGILFVIMLVLLAAPIVYIHVACNSGGIQARPNDQSQLPAAIVQALPDPSQWKRPEADSFLTYPEWYIVHTSQDYARYLVDRSASGFRYFASAFGFWTSYCEMNRHVTSRYPFSRDAHITDYVIGVSHSAEFILRGIYENTIGRLSELFANGAPTAEERYAQIYWADYGNFLKTTPWYDYPYVDRQRDLWNKVNSDGPGQFRKWERRLALSTEFAAKGVYAKMIGGGTKAAFAPVVPTTLAVVERMPPSIPGTFRNVKILAQSGDLSLVSFPRYAPFTDIALRMAESSGARFVEIAGNRSVLVTVASPREVRTQIRGAREIFRTDMLAGNGGSRVGIAVPVDGLLDLVRELKQQGQWVEHIYDY